MHLLQNTIFTIFQTFSNIRPKSPCSAEVTKKSILFKSVTIDHLSFFTQGVKLISERVCKKMAARRHRFGLFNSLITSHWSWVTFCPTSSRQGVQILRETHNNFNIWSSEKE